MADDHSSDELLPIQKEIHILPSKKSSKKSKYILCKICAIISVVLLLCTSFGAGFLLGWSINESTEPAVNSWGAIVTVNGQSQPIGDYVSESLDSNKIKENLRQLTARPHIAGKEQNKDIANLIYQSFSQNNFDLVEMTNYSVLLSYVNRSNYNVLKVLNDDKDVLYTAETRQEPPLTPGENDTDVPPPFNSYSGVGSAEGPLVYVNYAQFKDFDYITKNLSLNITGHICIARYGRIYRGDKAHLAQRFGCTGLIIYSDPADVAPKGGPPVYPNGPSLPPGGLQRGSVMISSGDPLTPGIPAVDEVYRRSYEDVIRSGDVPAIPVQPISYGDAVHFMNQLDTYEVPLSWKGELNITNYYIYQSTSNTNLTFLQVNNILERRTISNVFAVIYGKVEPDHLVMLGNHHDAWTFGAVDPNSGTAALMDIARVLGDLRNTGWRPGRTVVLCSWDAEEYGLIGSTEYVEDVEKLLGANAMAYLNVDVAVEGMESFSASSSPLLYESIYNATKQVACPCNDFQTVYEQWKNHSKSSKPRINNLSSASDFTFFIQSLGVTSCDIDYQNSYHYFVYHSVHDNFYWMSHFGDPDFTHHKALGEVWLTVAMALSTTPILPYNPIDYSERLMELYNELQTTYGSQLQHHNISTEFLYSCLTDFSTAATNLHNTLIKYADTDNENIVRILNNKLMNIERSFILPEGLPGRPYYKHVIFAPSSVNSYEGASFPGVVDSIFNATTLEDWNEVHHQLDIVAIHVRYATQIMNQPSIKWVN